MTKHHNDRVKKEPKPIPTLGQFLLSLKWLSPAGAWVPFWFVIFFAAFVSLFSIDVGLYALAFGLPIWLFFALRDAKKMYYDAYNKALNSS